jgi:uncharacterized protein (TIGR03000 family)
MTALAGFALLAAAGPLAARAMQETKEAYLVVTVPEGAKLLVDGYETKTKGEVRRFETPPLAMGKKYSYKLKATWTDEAGKEVVRERKVTVKAGEETSVDLRKEEPKKEEMGTGDKSGKKEDKSEQVKPPKKDGKETPPKPNVPKIEEEEEKPAKDKPAKSEDKKPAKDADKKATDKGAKDNPPPDK